MTALPGGDLIAAGLAELDQGAETIASLLVSIGAPRLRRLGLEVPPVWPSRSSGYALLVCEHGDATHSRYNALIRRLVSFERAAGA